MAKRKGIAGKIVGGALALCVAASCVSLLGYTSRDNNGNWFGGLHWADNNITADGDDVKNENGGAVVSEGESNGMLMLASAIPLNSYEEYGVSPLAENAYSLSVTYTPSDTTFKQTSFTAAFKNPSSSWANGKKVSDYVTVTSTGNTTATLTVLKPFSEQIIVTAANNKNSSVKSTTIVDYVCATLNTLSVDGQTECGDDIYLTYNGWSNGTLTPEKSETITFVYDVGASFVSAASAAGFTVKRYYSQIVPLVEGVDCCVLNISNIYRSGICNYDSMTTSQKAEYNQFLGRQLAGKADGASVGKYGFSYKRIYNGITYSTYDITQDSSGNWLNYTYGTNWADYFYVSATSMSSNTSSIIAG